jgi:SAM-dependent methyltransferase
LVKGCLASWESLNPDWDFRCLDAGTVARYVDLEEHIDLRTKTITAASLSDIVRLLLLHEFGGVWADATLYCNQPLNDWLPSAAGTGFFAFANPGPDRLLASWFLAAAPGNRLLAKWTARVINYWQGRTQSNDYFWLHHQFGELCSLDDEARSAWQSVPRISAAGPQTIHRIGMYKPAKKVLEDIDWTTPVFKLTHRIDEKAYRPGCLADYLLNSRAPARPASTEKTRQVPTRPEVRIAGLKVTGENLGDHIQIHAGRQFLKRFGLTTEFLIDRDHEIAGAAVLKDHAGPLGILLNGWFKFNPRQWPPHQKLIPVYLGFHIRLFQAPTLISPQALEHYRRFGPIGCRDRYTLSLLRSHGIDAFLSHCLSLMFSRRLVDPDNQTETLVVSRDRGILDYLPPSIRSCEFVCHYSGDSDFERNMKRAEELLALYRSKARLIVTTLLHCALPAIAMGIPVVIFFPPQKGERTQSDRERFSSLQEVIRVFKPNEANLVDWRGYTADISQIKLNAIDRMYELAQRWGPLPGKVLGPIAPASALPLPTGRATEEYINDPARLGAMARAAAPDLQRWGLPRSFSPDSLKRAKFVAPLIPKRVRVLEIGAGTGALKALIEDRCDYVGADLVPLDDEIRPLDMDRDPLPHDRYDCIVALEVFEYLHRPAEAVEKIAAATPHVINSYCCAREGTPGLAELRNRRGWVNHFSESEFTQIFISQGFRVASRKIFSSTADFDQIVFEFRKPF